MSEGRPETHESAHPSAADDESGLELPAERGKRPGQGNRQSIAIVVGLIAAVIGIVALVLTNFKDSTVYAKGVDQLVAEKSKWVGRTVRVEGMLVRGTLVFREKPCEYQFDAERAGAKIHVRYASCIKPDTLRDDMPEVGVTAEGKLLDNGDFIATNVLAKCPSKYEMKDKAQKGYTGTEVPGTKPAPNAPIN